MLRGFFGYFRLLCGTLFQPQISRSGAAFVNLLNRVFLCKLKCIYAHLLKIRGNLFSVFLSFLKTNLRKSVKSAG